MFIAIALLYFATHLSFRVPEPLCSLRKPKLKIFKNLSMECSEFKIFCVLTHFSEFSDISMVTNSTRITTAPITFSITGH